MLNFPCFVGIPKYSRYDRDFRAENTNCVISFAYTRAASTMPTKNTSVKIEERMDSVNYENAQHVAERDRRGAEKHLEE